MRFVTYLAPSIPAAFYQALAEQVARSLGLESVLEVDVRRSGPQVNADPFSRGQADVGFMCAPCYQELCELPTPPVELLVAPVYADPRNEGRPVYFSEVVVRLDADYADFADAACRGRWTYNDQGSLSGYHSVLHRVRELGRSIDVFADAVQSGSHLRSLELVAEGAFDAAAIDANVLAMRLEADGRTLDRLRILTTLGPHPVQPVVVRAGLPTELKDRLRRVLLDLAEDPAGAELLARYRIQRFVHVDDTDYASP